MKGHFRSGYVRSDGFSVKPATVKAYCKVLSRLAPDRVFYWQGRKDVYVQEDGKASPGEDYANNLEYYLYDPDILKKVTPQAYRWTKKQFGDDFMIRGRKK